MAGYHIREIPTGLIGYFSKIKEEMVEFEDAIDQNSSVMALVELCDLLGAIECFYIQNGNVENFNESIKDLNLDRDGSKIKAINENYLLIIFKMIEDDFNSSNELKLSFLLIGIKNYLKNFNMRLNDLYIMSQITRRVFLNGHRKAKE